MNTLETRIPPPLVALAVLAVMGSLSLVLPQLVIAWPMRAVAASVIALTGLAFSVAGAVSFRMAKTTVNPLRPENATSLVTSGVYRVTRNPMYLGLALVLLAWAVLLASPVLVLGPVGFVAYINRFQIGPEERVLSARFGPAFEAYRARVRRWL